MTSKAKGPAQLHVTYKSNRIIGPALTGRVSDPASSSLLTVEATTALEVYYQQADRAIRSLNFSEAEVQLMLNVVNGWFVSPDSAPYLRMEVEDALEDGLAEKWGVDAPALLQKLSALDAFTVSVLSVTLKAAWETRGRYGDDLLTAARALNLLPPADMPGRNL